MSSDDDGSGLCGRGGEGRGDASLRGGGDGGGNDPSYRGAQHVVARYTQSAESGEGVEGWFGGQE